MSRPSLDFMITVKADEATLCEIHNKLINARAECSPLSEVLSVIVQQTFIAAGIKNDFDVKFHCLSLEERVTPEQVAQVDKTH